jgi:hypothetical protein
LSVDETGDLRQAEEYWRLASENARDDVSKVRCELLRIRLLARQGRSEEARTMARTLAARADLPRQPGLRLLILLEVLIQHGPLESWEPLLAAVQAVTPVTRRLLLLAGELRRYAWDHALLDAAGSALLGLLPRVDDEGMDPALALLLVAEVMRVAGRTDEARRLLQTAEQGCRNPLRLTTLRQVYLANDRIGWDPVALLDTTLDRLADPSSGESPELAGLALLEHAERIAATLGDAERASTLLAQAEILLKPAAALWSARMAALRARIARLHSDRDGVLRYADQAVKAYLAGDDPV